MKGVEKKEITMTEYSDTELYRQSFHSALCDGTVYATEQGIVKLELCTFCDSERKNALTEKCCRELSEYFAGQRQTFDLPLILRGTPFSLRVWEALKTVPYGSTVSYKEIAAAVGSPKACRAVGGANHANPLPILIPCHRVIAANGKPGGYAYPIELKEKLLALERRYKI